jgi:UPF0755 protein
MSELGERARVRDARQIQRRRRSFLIVVIVVLGLFTVLGAFAVRSVFGGPADFEGSGTGSVTVTIPSGASATRIGEILTEQGVVASVGAFTAAAADDPASRGIQPGTYAMAEGMSGEAALQRLLDPAARVVAKVVVPEGSTVEEIVAAIASSTTIPRADLDKVVADPESLPLPAYAQNQLEGFLFPATYEVDPGDSAEDVLTAMVVRFNEVATEINLEARAKESGRSPYDIVVIASLVEAEVAPVDFGKASRVIDNRLSAGMRLQLDSTVNYAKGSSDLTLSSGDLAVDSPYNTYRVTGLPPTPIGSPSEAALEAALDPDDGDWIYFVTTDPEQGITKFTASYDEFLRFKAEFQATQR